MTLGRFIISPHSFLNSQFIPSRYLLLFAAAKMYIIYIYTKYSIDTYRNSVYIVYVHYVDINSNEVIQAENHYFQRLERSDIHANIEPNQTEHSEWGIACR